MMLAPSASRSMNATVLGDTDMTLMRAYFVKPQAAIAMSFSDDPQMGLICDRFTGSATATLATQSFVPAAPPSQLASLERELAHSIPSACI